MHTSREDNETPHMSTGNNALEQKLKASRRVLVIQGRVTHHMYLSNAIAIHVLHGESLDVVLSNDPPLPMVHITKSNVHKLYIQDQNQDPERHHTLCTMLFSFPSLCLKMTLIVSVSRRCVTF